MQDFDKVVAEHHFSEIAKEGILQTRYYAHTHPSQPNYLAAVAGDYWGLDHDDFVRVPSKIATVVDLLDVKGITWAGYFEGSPGPGYMGNASSSTVDGAWDYVRKHK